MLTIQILDGGETFFRQLDRHAVTFGASERADVQLREDGVAPLHVRIEPIGDDPSAGFKIVDLGSAAGTTVNGEPIAQWRLELGDRVEIGRALLIVGQRRERPATAKDVLERSTLNSRPTPLRMAPAGARRPAAGRSKSSPVLLGAIVVGLALCVVIFLTSSDRGTPPSTWGEVAMRARVGEFDAARARIVLLRRDWAGGDAQRSARVDALEADVDALEQAVIAGRERLRREATHDTKAVQIRALREAHTAEPDSVGGQAARILLADLEEIRLGIVTVQDVATVSTDATTENGAGAGSTVAAPTDSAAGEVATTLATIRDLCEQGEPVSALRAIDTALARGAGADEADLRELQGQINEELEAAASALVSDARSLAASGRRADRQRAIEMLSGAADRFPPTGGGGGLISAEVLRLRRAAETGGGETDSVDGPTYDIEADEIFDAAQRCESRGEYATAWSMLRSIADRDPERVRAAMGMLEPLAALESHLIDQSRDAPTRLQSVDGAPVDLRVDDDANLRTATGELVPWSKLQPAAVGAFLRTSKAPPAAVMGAAVLSYRAGDAKLAERWLEPLLSEAETRSAASRIIADGRGDVIVDERGYRVVEGVLVSVREIEQREAGRRVERRINDALRRDVATRTAVLDEILAEDPALAEPTLFVLRQKLGESVAAIEKDPFRKVWDRLAAQRAELDARRSHALALIFDRKQYFSPYKPPAVSAARYAEYRKVQDEIDARVDAVRDLWNAKGVVRKPPAALARRLERVQWIVDVVTDFGEDVALAQQRIAWTRTLPSDGGLTLRNFCRAVDERRRLDEIERIRAFNRRCCKELPQAEAKQFEITNAYRELLGRAPLAFNAKLLAAARGHAEEMSRLGYFSHTSPTEGRRTPFERMKGAGYPSGVAENIAKHPSAESAHFGWTHSSGHHRNLLMDSHGEFAVGNDGNHWVQNFGSGSEYRTHPNYSRQD